jgi:anti-sigma B factor antagonist
MLSDHPLAISRREAAASGTSIFTLDGPVTLPNLFTLQAELRNGQPPSSVILDLSGVPYMDSAGMGAIVNYFVHCQNRGVKLITVGICSRVHELFKMTKVDTVIPCFPTVEEAEAQA